MDREELERLLRQLIFRDEAEHKDRAWHEILVEFDRLTEELKYAYVKLQWERESKQNFIDKAVEAIKEVAELKQENEELQGMVLSLPRQIEQLEQENERLKNTVQSLQISNNEREERACKAESLQGRTQKWLEEFQGVAAEQTLKAEALERICGLSGDYKVKWLREYADKLKGEYFHYAASVVNALCDYLDSQQEKPEYLSTEELKKFWETHKGAKEALIEELARLPFAEKVAITERLQRDAEALQEAKERPIGLGETPLEAVNEYLCKPTAGETDAIEFLEKHLAEKRLREILKSWAPWIRSEDLIRNILKEFELRRE